jgi:hypothetical protein
VAQDYGHCPIKGDEGGGVYILVSLVHQLFVVFKKKKKKWEEKPTSSLCCRNSIAKFIRSGVFRGGERESVLNECACES